MRKISLIASVTLLMGGALMSPGPSLAADCTKGMLWPFVRAAGDCLTDAEIAAGQRGVYSGPTNTNVDVSAIKPADVPAQTGPAGSFGNSNGALIDTSVFGAEPNARPAAQCHKAILWPFDREPGDCLTEGEKRAGQTGVYTGDPGAAQPTTITSLPAGSASPAAAPQAASCSKSWLWPFGDCPAAGEQASTSVVVPAAATSPVAAPQAAPQAPSCSKSLLWPFVKESGDCQSAGDKKSGETEAHGPAAAVTPASIKTTAPAAAAPAVQAPPPAPAPQAASCSKSLFWPFVKESGDCSSAAEKQAGGTATMTQASATTTVPAATTTVPTAPSAQAPRATQPATQAASCSKPLLWPFVKESGDCSSDADKKK